MLGTALNFVSVGVAVGVAVLMGLIFPGVLAWTLGGFMAAAAYVMLEAAELAVAGCVMRSRRRREDGADADPG